MRFTIFNFSFQIIQHAVIMYPTEHLLFDQSKLFSCRKLSFAREAGKASQVIHIPLSPSDPVSRMDVPATTRTTGSIPSTKKKSVLAVEHITETILGLNCHRLNFKGHDYLMFTVNAIDFIEKI